MNAHVPEPTVWPAALATGATLAAAGLVTSPLLVVFGGGLVLAALAGWVRLLTDGPAHGGSGERAHAGSGERANTGEEYRR